MNGPLVVLVGNISDGFAVYGPFEDFDAVQDFYARVKGRDECWTMPLWNQEDYFS